MDLDVQLPLELEVIRVEEEEAGGGGVDAAVTRARARLPSHSNVLISTVAPAPPQASNSFASDLFSSLVSAGFMKELCDGSPHSTGQGHGSGDERKKNHFLQSIGVFGIPAKRKPELSLARKQNQPLCLRLTMDSRKKRRNTGSDGGTPTERQSTR